jgi:hypothetical protein
MIAIDVRSKNVSENHIRQFAERRISFALDHLRDLQRLAISIEDVNSPKGGSDKHCRIWFHLVGAGRNPTRLAKCDRPGDPST